MATVKHHKVVAALPAELEPDALYLVRSGAGFDLYATNHSGLIAAYPLNVGPPGQGFFRTEPITATAAGQTVFTVPGGYTPGAIFVSLNGASLPPADYTALNGTTVVLATGQGIVAGSVLLVYVLSAFEVADALPIGGTAADSSKLGGIPAAEFYRRSNILGTVSKSGGVPTGAIIERGSNANGEYVRFADGTQICWLRESVAGAPTVGFGSIFRSQTITWTFPAAFASAPSVSVASNSIGIWVDAQIPSGSSVGLRLYSAASQSGSFTAQCIATGRWF